MAESETSKLYTIKEVAEELQTSKTTVSKFAKNVCESLRQVGNKILLSEEDVERIKAEFMRTHGINTESQTANRKESQSTENESQTAKPGKVQLTAEEYRLMTEQIDLLKNQVEQQSKDIEWLRGQVTQAQEQVKFAQGMQLKAERQLLQLEMSPEESEDTNKDIVTEDVSGSSGSETNTGKPSIWARLFKRMPSANK